MEKNKRTVLTVLALFLAVSCAGPGTAVKRARTTLSGLNDLPGDTEKLGALASIRSELGPYVEKGARNEEAYIVYINMLYETALLEPGNRKDHYGNASLTALLWKKVFPGSVIANYYIAKSLYLTESKEPEVIKKITGNALFAAKNLPAEKFSAEIAELKDILEDLDPVH